MKMRKYEQIVIGTGEVIDRFYSHKHPLEKIDPKYPNKLWQEENFESMGYDSKKQFTGTTLLHRVD